jgi:hypothetical protein
MIIIDVSDKVADWMPPFSKGAAALCVFPFVFILKRIQGQTRDTILIHEKVHWVRQRDFLCIPWYILYGISKKFRLSEEVLAYRTEYDYRRANNIPYSKDTVARQLASRTYNNMVSLDEARNIVRSWPD